MLKLARKIRDVLFRDNLFLRVTIFMTGALIASIPLAAVLLGTLSKISDPAFYILLILLAFIAVFLLYAASFGSTRSLDKATNWAGPDEILLFLGLITLAIPITLLIRLYQNRRN